MIDLVKSLRLSLSKNASTVIVFVAALAYLAYIGPDKASEQFIQVLLAAGGIARLLYQVDETKAKATEAAKTATVAANTATQAAAQSVDNGMQLALIAPQVDAAVAAVADNTVVTLETQQTGKETHQAVNHRMDDLIARVEGQGRALAALAGAQGRAEGIETGRAQVQQEGVSADHLPADTVEVVASLPALIKVVAPPAEPQP